MFEGGNLMIGNHKRKNMSWWREEMSFVCGPLFSVFFFLPVLKCALLGGKTIHRLPSHVYWIGFQIPHNRDQ